VALAEKVYTEAQQVLQESIAIYRKIAQRQDLARALAALGYTARGLGQRPQAWQYLADALRITTEIQAFLPLMYILPAITLLLADQNEEERAVDLYALASRYEFVTNSHWFEDVAGKHITAIAATLSPKVVSAAQERGRARDLWATAEELMVELIPKHNSERDNPTAQG
jgi:tetratricopeptide (TPR) repeat protein